MKNKKQIVLCTAIAVLCFALLLFFDGYLLLLHHYKGREVVDAWSATDQFEIQSISKVYKQKNQDFVILNLADIQMCDLEDIWHQKTIKAELDYLISQAKPNLITLTGDQTWSNENLISLTTLVCWLDSYKIPYAPVFGNHDYGNTKNSAVVSQNACCDIYEHGKYSLFRRGPSNLGALGNYVINIVEEDKIYKTLYMIDSGYENKITDNQIAWFAWNAEGIKQANDGEYSSGMCFMHKPLPEFQTAYSKYCLGSTEVEAVGDVHVNYSLSGSLQNGFFEMAKSKNVEDIVCGHQHGNNFTLKFQNIRLTFALKTGELGGYCFENGVYLNGATAFYLNQEGVQISNIFADYNSFHINKK